MKIIEVSQKLRKQLENELKPDRFDHTLGVAYTAASMAIVHGADFQKALIAGMLHDCAKCVPDDLKVSECQKYDIELSEVELVKRFPLLTLVLNIYLVISFIFF